MIKCSSLTPIVSWVPKHRYYEDDLPKEDHPEHIYVNTDVRLDPTGDLLPTDWFVELHSAVSCRSKRLLEWTEEQVLESEALQVDTESHSDSGDIIGEGDNGLMYSEH